MLAFRGVLILLNPGCPSVREYCFHGEKLDRLAQWRPMPSEVPRLEEIEVQAGQFGLAGHCQGSEFEEFLATWRHASSIQ